MLQFSGRDYKASSGRQDRRVAAAGAGETVCWATLVRVQRRTTITHRCSNRMVVSSRRVYRWLEPIARA